MSSLALMRKLALGGIGVLFVPWFVYSQIDLRQGVYHIDFSLVFFSIPFMVLYAPVAMADEGHAWHWSTWSLIGLAFNVVAAFLIGAWLIFQSLRIMFSDNPKEQVDE